MHESMQITVGNISEILHITVLPDLTDNLPVTEQPESGNNQDSNDCPERHTDASLCIIIKRGSASPLFSVTE
ncbi:hypothetical protein [Desulfonema magnum]|uniref:Uncharacterized protein n=1 Tax=Desulfonema magnum TaxID=45655 RepID=A0A975BXL6_9BACT|nr:hypothetical protein [Desulfonema magnum]QTA93055.1 Uncharacterized protein dnm_091500 [Desulfonema magnum]